MINEPTERNDAFPTNLLGATVEIVNREYRSLIVRGKVRAIESLRGSWTFVIEPIETTEYEHVPAGAEFGDLVFVAVDYDHVVRVVQRCVDCATPMHPEWFTTRELVAHFKRTHSEEAQVAHAKSLEEWEERARAAHARMREHRPDLTDDEANDAAWLASSTMKSMAPLRIDAIFGAAKAEIISLQNRPTTAAENVEDGQGEGVM